MHKEYKLKTGWLIFFFIFTIGAVALGVGVMKQNFAEDKSFWATVAWGVLAASMPALGLYGILDGFKTRIITTNNSIRQISLFGERELSFDQIKGFKRDQNYIRIIPKDKERKSIKASTYYGNLGELHGWLNGRFKDLDREELETLKTDLKTNSKYGKNESEREVLLKKAKWITRTLHIILGLCAAILIFYPPSFKSVLFILILLPWISLILVLKFKGLIKFLPEKNSPYPTIGFAIIVASLILILKTSSYNLISESTVFLFALIFLIPSIILAVYLLKNVTFEIPQNAKWHEFLVMTFVSVLLFLGHSFGTTAIINCMFDNSTSKTYQAQIERKYISSGKRSAPHFTLSSWGPQAQSEDIQVWDEIYEQKNEGDSIHVYLKPGLLNIPWYYIDN